MNIELIGTNPHKLFLQDCRSDLKFNIVNDRDMIYMGQTIINEAATLKDNQNNRYNISHICADTGIKKATLYDWVDATPRKTRTSLQNLLRFSFERNKRLILRPMIDKSKQTLDEFSYVTSSTREWYAEFHGYLYDNDALEREFMIWSKKDFLNSLPKNKLSVIPSKDATDVYMIESSMEQHEFDFNTWGDESYFFDVRNNDVKVACYGENYNVRDTYALFRDFKYSRLTSGSPLTDEDVMSIPHYYILPHNKEGISNIYESFLHGLGLLGNQARMEPMSLSDFQKQYYAGIDRDLRSNPKYIKNSTAMITHLLKRGVSDFRPSSVRPTHYSSGSIGREMEASGSVASMINSSGLKSVPIIRRNQFLGDLVRNSIQMRMHCRKVTEGKKITEQPIVVADIKKYIPLYSETEMLHEVNKWRESSSDEGIPQTDKSVRYRGNLNTDNLFAILMTGEHYYPHEDPEEVGTYSSIYPKGTILIISTTEAFANNNEVIVQMRGGMRGLGTYNARAGRDSYLQRWERDTNFPDLLFCTDAPEVNRRDKEFGDWIKAHPETDPSIPNIKDEDLEKGWQKWNELKLGEIRDWVYRVVEIIEPK